MVQRSPLTINRLDAERLQRLIDDAETGLDVAEALEAELERSEVLDPEDMPDDVVSMNSQVEFTDIGKDRRFKRTLVYPHSLATIEDGISVMAPVGAALLGLRVGETIEWPLPGGQTVTLRIESVLWQPEREGQFHR